MFKLILNNFFLLQNTITIPITGMLFRSLVFQLTILSRDTLLCFRCFKKHIAYDSDGNLICTGCHIQFADRHSLSDTVEHVQRLLLDHAQLCPEVFLQISMHCYNLKIDCNKCKISYYIKI